MKKIDPVPQPKHTAIEKRRRPAMVSTVQLQGVTYCGGEGESRREVVG
jgi:hypothetical protein